MRVDKTSGSVKVKSVENAASSVGQLAESYNVLRPLHLEDATLMLEWMHDSAISSVFQTDFTTYSLSDVSRFINSSYNDTTSLHFAIQHIDGEYLGTISLKNIDCHNSNAEYAIVTRRKAHGTGVAKVATGEILDMAFSRLRLHKIYLNVLDSNTRAISFYEKIGFKREGTFHEHLYIRDCYEDLHYYGMTVDAWKQGVMEGKGRTR